MSRLACGINSLKTLTIRTAASTVRHPSPLCHPDRSEAQWRDLQSSRKVENLTFPPPPGARSSRFVHQGRSQAQTPAVYFPDQACSDYLGLRSGPHHDPGCPISRSFLTRCGIPQLYPRTFPRPTLLHVIVRSLTSNNHIVHMTLAQPSARNPNKTRLLLQLLNRAASHVPHPRP